VHSFTAGFDGSTPYGSLSVDSSGALYGTTQSGGGCGGHGGFGCGSVFRLTPPGPGQTTWTKTTLYNFKGGNDGVGPQAGLIADSTGALYGTTTQGGGSANCGATRAGVNYGCGTVFRLKPPATGKTAWTETVLHSFSAGANGSNPQAALIADTGGALYGTTYSGGNGCPAINSFGCGTVFKLTPPAKGQTIWTETVLYSFTGAADGGNPTAGLVTASAGVLMGTTTGAQSSTASSAGNCVAGLADGCGTVFKLTPPAPGQTAWTETVLYGFKGMTDGYHAYGGLVADKTGAVYGTTGSGGGSANCPGGCGTVFKVTQ